MVASGRLVCLAALAAGLSLLAAPRAGHAQPAGAGAVRPAARHNALSASPLGALGFLRLNVGSFAVNYEHKIAGRHGVLAEFNFLHVHGGTTHLWTFGGTLGYRYHFTGPASSPFVGLNVGYRAGWGAVGTAAHHTTAAEVVRVAIQQFSVVPNVGYRWITPGGFTVTARFGVGYGEYHVSSSQSGEAAAQGVAQAHDALGFTPVALDTELSVGYSF